MKNLQSFANEFPKEMKWDIDTSSYERSRASLLNNFMLGFMASYKIISITSC